MKELFLKIKNKLTKRVILALANCIFLICVVIFFSLHLADVNEYLNELRTAYIAQTVYRFLLIQCLFTFLSFIVYYLSIMADALNKKYKEQVKDREDKTN